MYSCLTSFSRLLIVLLDVSLAAAELPQHIVEPVHQEGAVVPLVIRRTALSKARHSQLPVWDPTKCPGHFCTQMTLAKLVIFIILDELTSHILIPTLYHRTKSEEQLSQRHDTHNSQYGSLQNVRVIFAPE